MRCARGIAGLMGVLCALSGSAHAGGPRWVTGPPYFSTSGVPVAWGTKNLLYSTDPGDLSAYVNHAAADAMVATAASAWNVAASSMVVSQGGFLAEDVSGANVYLGSNGPVFPADVMASNAASIPVAVIYDTDGAVTDVLLGGGASDPGNCRQTAVTESVDGISAAGKITHALLIVNGRCTGSDPAMQMEMTYRLIRGFGRVLGLGWSQANDNVFTGVPAATYAQALHWPMMHPIDVMCGPYAYQCMPQPFTIRPDDIGAMVLLYPETGADAGKTSSQVHAGPLSGVMSFPNGQGMAGVNVVARRQNQSTQVWDLFDMVSGVTGYKFQQTGATPVGAKGTTVQASLGGSTSTLEGRYDLAWIPVDTTTTWETLLVSTQAINPLYTGQYAVGPYGFTSQVAPSGSNLSVTKMGFGQASTLSVNLAATNAVSTCGAGSDGTATAPVMVDPSGLWTGSMCGYGHTAWTNVAVKGGRTLTLEVTAVDEQGLATTAKMQPVFGVWASTDAVGTLPTVAAAVTPMNTATLGLTAMTVGSPTAGTLRVGLGDQRGDGRPDYGYKARVLYADSVTPLNIPLNGGQITIAGMGFRSGNAVMVNGVAAQVLSWTANTIVAVAPAMTGAMTADVTVTDLSTAGQTTVSGALTYGATGLPDVVSVMSAPADGSVLGAVAAKVFAVKVTLGDGVTPAAGVAVAVSASNGAWFLGCGGGSACSMTTDASGMVRSGVVPVNSGTVVLGATVGTVMASASFVAAGRAADVLRVTSLPGGTVFAGVAAGLPLIVQALLGDGVTPDAGAQVTVTAVGAGLGGCGGASTCVLTADSAGLVATTVVPAAAGVVSLQASAGGGMVAASFGVVAMPVDVLRVVAAPADGAFVGTVAGSGFQVKVLLGDGVTPAAGAAVTLSAIGAGLGACGGAATCTVAADGTGLVSTAVTPGLVGTATLTAAAGGGAVHASFSVQAAPPDRLEVVSVPVSGSLVGSVAGGTFGLRLLLPDGVTPVVGAAMTLKVTGGALGVCGAATCSVVTDATGLAASTVTAFAAGVIGLSATGAGVTASTSFVALADGVRLVSVPVGLVYVGVPTQMPVVFQVIGPDGTTPAAGAQVTVSTTLGTLVACGAVSCLMTADGRGLVSTQVTPAAKGVVSITASAGGGVAGTSFNVLVMPPDVVRILGAPSGLVYAGVTAATPFTAQVFLGDGVTVHPGASVPILSANASLLLNNCGTSCVRTADANGVISSQLYPLAAGLVTLYARAGSMQASTTFMATALPPDGLTVMSVPADGSAVGKSRRLRLRCR